MPMAVKEGGTSIAVIITILTFFVVLHGTLISTALKIYVGAPKGKSVETDLLPDVCDKMGARGPEFLKLGGLHVANMIRLAEFFGHIFRSAFYINIMVDVLATLPVFENLPNAFLVLIITLCSVFLAPIAQVWQLRLVLSCIGTIIFMVVFGFVIGESSGNKVDDELVDKRGDPQYIPFCVGKIIFTMGYFSPHLNPDFRQPTLAYIPPYAIGLVLYTVFSLMVGTVLYKAYTEDTMALIILNLKNK